ncbi:DUF6069 family protein [Paractinoplanes atraurantiacus]|uniref:PEP-CTERM protein-sorting domain-containing protein n=1 Tax=Paractinoplanes atraurantiacus TaxID=1036182 RepID=A0A285H759_9ACTN|nr:DUF6069 family protein [Actinoplanes atraurantiacus]SNY31393.1 hypothetical protein SAMN05421748_103550 [Actinoplanes atraurantiacus]
MTTVAAPARISWKSTLAAAGLGAVGGLILNTAIAWGARTLADIPSEFQQLTLPVYGFLTVLGALIGAIGWRLIVNRSRNAGRLLTWLVPVVLVLSMIPNVLLLVSKAQPGTTTAGVVALMLMHIAVAVAAVPAYRRLMPPRS